MGSKRLEIFKATFQSEEIMKAIIILSFVTMAHALGCAHAHPGGYLAKGGVVDFKRPLDYMKDAVLAGKKGWDAKFTDELQGQGAEPNRNIKRNTESYIPTFFTSQQNHEALTQSRNDYVRLERDEPLYYETYHNTNRR